MWESWCKKKKKPPKKKPTKNKIKTKKEQTENPENKAVIDFEETPVHVLFLIEF